jgi:hypothetical protein
LMFKCFKCQDMNIMLQSVQTRESWWLEIMVIWKACCPTLV